MLNDSASHGMTTATTLYRAPENHEIAHQFIFPSCTSFHIPDGPHERLQDMIACIMHAEHSRLGVARIPAAVEDPESQSFPHLAVRAGAIS